MTGLIESYIGTCPQCGKRSFPSKKAAKRAARRNRATGRMSPYRCGDWWHYGHLPRVVVEGRVQRPKRKTSERIES